MRDRGRQGKQIAVTLRSVLFTVLVGAAALRAAACSSSKAGDGPGGPGGAQQDASAATADSGAPGSVDGGSVENGDTDGGGAQASDANFWTDAPAVSVDPGALPSQGTYLGAFVDVINDAGTDINSEQRFVAAEELIGREWTIDNRFYSDSDEFVSDRTQWDKASHLVPLITWMPYGNGDPLTEIIEGVHDAAIQAEAQKAKGLGVQILMRWGHEMNGNWYPWGGYVNGEGGNAAEDGGGVDDAGLPASGPAKYIAAWRHVHDIFVAEGATNVFWVWCPNAADVPAVPWNHWTNYYPGDDYVDWVGIDAYNWGTSSSCCVWQSFATLLTPSPYQDYVGKKPLILPETASAEVGGNKAQWIATEEQNLKTEFAGIRAVVWFDINKETDWRINSSPSALAAYTAMAHDPFFNPE